MNEDSICTQPRCALRKAEVDREFLVDAIVESLAGRSIVEITNPSEAIVPRLACRECADRVLAGGRPLQLPEERLRDERAGRFSHRRHRRHE